MSSSLKAPGLVDHLLSEDLRLSRRQVELEVDSRRRELEQERERGQRLRRQLDLLSNRVQYDEESEDVDDTSCLASALSASSKLRVLSAARGVTIVPDPLDGNEITFRFTPYFRGKSDEAFALTLGCRDEEILDKLVYSDLPLSDERVEERIQMHSQVINDLNAFADGLALDLRAFVSRRCQVAEMRSCFEEALSGVRHDDHFTSLRLVVCVDEMELQINLEYDPESERPCRVRVIDDQPSTSSSRRLSKFRSFEKKCEAFYNLELKDAFNNAFVL